MKNFKHEDILDEVIATPESIFSKRFWSKVDIKGKWECWEWLGGKNTGRNGKPGYGRFFDGERNVCAHIIAYKLIYGNFPKRFENGRMVIVRHLCGNCSCVNPLHLSIGTMSDNAEDIYKTRNFNKEQKRLVSLSRIK